jgi:hypothetical protein
MIIFEKKEKFQIYLDIDGLAADFDGGFKNMCGKYPRQVETKFLWRQLILTRIFFTIFH